jgi:tripartite-type tricarboxylate transporter receptor subunit TctC
VPTMAEAGVADLEVRLWSGLFAPAATPAGIVNKLEKELIEIVKLADVNERLKGLAVDPAGSTAEDFARMIAAELPRWAAIAKAANIKLG